MQTSEVSSRGQNNLRKIMKINDSMSHEYFRRILCNLVGSDVEKGELPDDPRVGKMIEAICFSNAKSYFGF
jgi:glucuronate isomerase